MEPVGQRSEAKPFLAFPEALYLEPLVHSLEGDTSAFRAVKELPASLAVKMSRRIGLDGPGCAFLTPIDYARHGAEYCILPGVAVSSSHPTGTVELYVKSNVRNISTMAVDIRVTSEIILAKIILMEKYRNVNSNDTIQVIPMMPDLDAMLSKADAAMIVNLAPTQKRRSDLFLLDLVDEWYDLTELPYVHGFWVGRQDEMYVDDLQRIIDARSEGTTALRTVAEHSAHSYRLSVDAAEQFLSSFSFQLGQEQLDSLQEYISYAFYFGVLPDIPEINFYDVGAPSPLGSN
jgi:predicted solute-binding protein